MIAWALIAGLVIADWWIMRTIGQRVDRAITRQRRELAVPEARLDDRRNGDLAREVMLAQRLERCEQILSAYGLDELP